MTPSRGFVILDDDPTGTQEVQDASVFMEADGAAIAAALAAEGAAYVLTNTRAFGADRARETVRDVVRAVTEHAPDARFILRGDSTLRGHVLAEYQGYRDTLASDAAPVLVVVPAMPDAGRVTRAGVHYLVRDGLAEPLGETEYSRDPVFGYRSSSVLEWADERSDGCFPASNGVRLDLDALRREGPDAVVEAIARAASRGGPAVFAPDAETWADLEIIAAGVQASTEALVVRSAPSLAAVLAGRRADRFIAPRPSGGVIVICGSHVPTTTRQLTEIERRHPGTGIEADLAVLDSDAPDAEIARLASAADDLIGRGGVAVIMTPRALDPARSALTSSVRIAENLARVLHAVRAPSLAVVSKGGITSAVVARIGFQASSARILGPVARGVSLWEMGGERQLAIFPGNVGTDAALADLTDVLLAAAQPSAVR